MQSLQTSVNLISFCSEKTCYTQLSAAMEQDCLLSEPLAAGNIPIGYKQCNNKTGTHKLVVRTAINSQKLKSNSKSLRSGKELAHLDLARSVSSTAEEDLKFGLCS